MTQIYYTLPLEELISAWRKAAAAEFGIRIHKSWSTLLHELYAARKESGDPSLDNLRICRMKNGELWIVKNEVKMEDEDGQGLS